MTKKKIKPVTPRVSLPPTDDSEPTSVTIARLRAKRDAIRGGKKNPRPVKTPFAYSLPTKKRKPKPKENAK